MQHNLHKIEFFSLFISFIRNSLNVISVSENRIELLEILLILIKMTLIISASNIINTKII